MSNSKWNVHLFYALASFLIYYGITIVLVSILGVWHLDTGIMTVFINVINMLVLYYGFYTKYNIWAPTRLMPGMLPGKVSVMMPKQHKMPGYSYIFIVILGISCSIGLNHLFEFLGLFETINDYKEVSKVIYGGSFFVVFLKTVVLASVVEELLLRGLVYRSFSHVVGRIPAMILASLIFAFIHGNVLQGMYAFILGILFSYVYDMYHRNLLAPMIAHASANLLSVLGSRFVGINKLIHEYFYGFMIGAIIVMILSVVCIYFCKKLTIEKTDKKV